jgi:hypothetical protein
MSGSDPSVRRNDGGGSIEDEDCPGQPFETVLASPNPDVVSQLDIDQLLDIVSVEEPARGVIAQTLDGDYVGAIVRDIVRLRRCIAAGNTYEADVVRIAGGSVTVLVRPT